MSRGNGTGRGRKTLEVSPTAPSGFLDEELMKALSHPLRVRILARLCEREATFGQLVAMAGESSSNVNYHLRQLQIAGFVTSAPGGGARTGRVYRSELETILPPGVWDGLPDAICEHLAAGLLRRLYEDAGASLAAGGFGPGAHLTVIPVVLDAEGAGDVAAVLERGSAEVGAIQATSNMRMTRPTQEGRSMTVALIAFESLRPAAEGATAAQAGRS